MSDIRNLAFAPSGHKKVKWVKNYMPVLSYLHKEVIETKPFKGQRIALSIHLEAKTAYLCHVLKDAGAEMFITGSNPLSTQDDVAASLVDAGMEVFAIHDVSKEGYLDHIRSVIEFKPTIIVDDGGDILNTMIEYYPEIAENVIGGCEETTTGVTRLRQLEMKDVLPFPMIAVNDAKCKYLFDNRYGTGQSVWDGINRTTNLVVAGKNVVVAGYGWCGKGVAMRAKGLGAKVIITEINPIKAIEASMDGFQVMSMEQAAEVGDLFVTVTGCNRVIRKSHMEKMKDGAVLCNAGHFNVEIDIPDLESISTKKFEAKHNIDGYHLKNGNTIYLLAKGRLVNLAAGDGHPVEIMDLSFSLQLLSMIYLIEHGHELDKRVIDVPEDVDRKVAEIKLTTWGYEIDKLTKEQEDYIGESRS